jgi:CRP/FNR family cyclic AMP-dependent transcriptional regulator
MRRLEDQMAATEVFAALDDRLLQLVAGCGVNEHVAAGAYLFREGEPAERFFLIRNGTVALEVVTPGRGAVVIETLHPGDVVGWSWLFAPYRWQFDGRAVAPTRTIAFDGLCLRTKCDADHELGYELMRRFAAVAVERLQATRLQLLDVYASPVGS